MAGKGQSWDEPWKEESDGGPLPFGEGTRDCSPGHAGKEGPQLANSSTLATSCEELTHLKTEEEAGLPEPKALWLS